MSVFVAGPVSQSVSKTMLLILIEILSIALFAPKPDAMLPINNLNFGASPLPAIIKKIAKRFSSCSYNLGMSRDV